MTEPFTATVLGLPRIGPKRELKKALEAYWAGDLTSDELAATGRALRETQLRGLADAGLDSVPVGTFSRYDQVLDTAVLLGALPERYTGFADPLDGYFAAARGTDELAPLEMTKWFDTNYHYIVPEISPGTQFSLHPETLLAELAEADALELGVPARPTRRATAPGAPGATIGRRHGHRPRTAHRARVPGPGLPRRDHRRARAPEAQ